MSTDDLTPLRTASEQSWQEDDAASAMNGNAVRGHEVFAAHAARLAALERVRAALDDNRARVGMNPGVRLPMLTGEIRRALEGES